MLLLNRILKLASHNASRALPIGLLLGLVLPPLAGALNPLLYFSLIIPLVIAISRIDWQQQINYLKRWKLISLLVVWVLVVCPLLIFSLLSWTSLPEPLLLALVMTAAAPPVTACAALGLFLKLDVAIIVVTTVVTMIAVPFLLPPLAYWLLDFELTISIWELSLRLGGFIFSAFILAFIVKKFVGTARIAKHSQSIDGIAVIAISCFIIGIMDGVTALILAQPLYALMVTVMGFVFILFLELVSLAVFWKLPKKTCLAIALVCGNCNLGLIYLVLADQAEVDVLLFFALGQIPMYTLPMLQAPIIRKILSLDHEPSLKS